MVQISIDNNVNPIITSNFIRLLIGTFPFLFINEKMLTDPPKEEKVEEEEKDWLSMNLYSFIINYQVHFPMSFWSLNLTIK